MNKKVILLLLILLVGSFLYFEKPLNVGASILFPHGGGTGKGTATAGDVGKYLKVSDDSPFTYTFDAPLSGGSTDGLTYWTSATTVGATSSPTIGWLTATTTTATSTFMGDVSLIGSASFFYPTLQLTNTGALANAEPNIRFRNTAGNITHAQIGSFPGASYTASALRFSVANSAKVLTERMRIDVNGNLGIGTTSPYAKLSVMGNVVADNFVATSTTATSTFVYDVDVSGNLHTGKYIGLTGATAATRPYNGDLIWRYSSGLVIDTGTGRDLFLNADNATRLFIESTNGNVGIGSVSPASRLAVLSNASIGANFNVAAPANGLLVEGNVGIGTTSPYAKLSVIGEVVASHFTATTTATSTFAGVIKANGGCIGCATTVYKSADETVNNSSTLQDDDALIIPVGQNEKWSFRIMVTATSNTTPDLKLGFSVPAGTTMKWRAANDNSDVTRAAADTEAIVVSDTSERLTYLEGVIISAGTAGNVTLQWAQNTADLSDTIVKTGSHLVANRIE